MGLGLALRVSTPIGSDWFVLYPVWWCSRKQADWFVCLLINSPIIFCKAAATVFRVYTISTWQYKTSISQKHNTKTQTLPTIDMALCHIQNQMPPVQHAAFLLSFITLSHTHTDTSASLTLTNPCTWSMADSWFHPTNCAGPILVIQTFHTFDTEERSPTFLSLWQLVFFNLWYNSPPWQAANTPQREPAEVESPNQDE